MITFHVFLLLKEVYVRFCYGESFLVFKCFHCYISVCDLTFIVNNLTGRCHAVTSASEGNRNGILKPYVI